MPEEVEKDKEERLCPECRSTISIWATKCKFCGSKVGRPKMREAKLTLKDLGGEAHDKHKVSKHVMSAIGTFRYDEVYANDPDKQQKKPNSTHTPKTAPLPTPKTQQNSSPKSTSSSSSSDSYP